MPFSNLRARLQMIYLLLFFPGWKTLDAFHVPIMHVVYHVNRIIDRITDYVTATVYLASVFSFLKPWISALINYRTWRPLRRKNTSTMFSTSVVKHMYSYIYKWQFYLVTSVRRHSAAMVSGYIAGSLNTETFEGTWLWKEHLQFISYNSDSNILLRCFTNSRNVLCSSLCRESCTKSD